MKYISTHFVYIFYILKITSPRWLPSTCIHSCILGMHSPHYCACHLHPYRHSFFFDAVFQSSNSPRAIPFPWGISRQIKRSCKPFSISIPWNYMYWEYLLQNIWVSHSEPMAQLVRTTNCEGHHAIIPSCTKVCFLHYLQTRWNLSAQRILLYFQDGVELVKKLF